jgi:hypothetical protein
MSEAKELSRSWKEREYQRLTYFEGLTIRIEESQNPVKPKTLDISQSGMFLNTEYLFPEGTILEISFTLPITKHAINVRAEVRYSLPGTGVGVKFIQISAEDRQAIEREISAARS